MTPLKPHRLPQLDALRTLAIILVLGRHLDALPPVDHPVLREIFVIWHRCGWMGVDLFFVLSGYLISGLLFREYRTHQTINLKRFLIRRGLKIYPAFAALIIFTCIYRIHEHTFVIREAVAQILFLQNYLRVDGQWVHTWSLAVEEHFYLLAAFACWVLNRKPNANLLRRVPAVFLLIAVACLALRFATSIIHPDFDAYKHIYPSHLRADALMFGVLLCYLDQFHHETFRSIFVRYRHPIGFISITLIVPAVVLEPETFFMRTAGLTMLYLGFGGTLMLMLESKTVETSRLIRWVGKIGFFSYSIYLWHIVCRHFVFSLNLPHFWELWTAFILGSIALGIVMSRMIEIPVLFFRDRLFPSDVPAVISDAFPGSTQKSSTRLSETPTQTG